jgi:hypothetical protein
MKICLCFIGLQRTISKTYQDIQANVIDNKNEFTIVYVTWKNENIDDFLRIYPDSIIHRVDEVKLEDEEFNKWKIGLNMHISWRRTYNSLDDCLFRYYQYTYLLKKAALFLDYMKESFDLYVRLRTDINISGEIVSSYYDDIKEDTVYFPTEPRESIFGGGTGCPEYYFLGKPSIVLKVLSVIDYVHKYKINYIERNQWWFPEPTPEENIVQPESLLYKFLIGENIFIEFLNNSIHIVR